MRHPAASALLLCGLAAAAAGAHGDERTERPNERFGLSAAFQSGRFVAWRLDRTDGRVSVCSRAGAAELVCSAFSEPAPSTAAGPFAINAENSSPVGTLWVWRIDTLSGRLDYCSVPCCQDLAAARPGCMEGAP